MKQPAPIPETTLDAKIAALIAERKELLNGKWCGLKSCMNMRLGEINDGLRRLGVEE